MQKIFYLTLAMLISLSACRMQVDREVAPALTEERLEDVYFINDSVGFAVGGKRYEKDIFLQTTNGGKTWISKDLGIGKIFFSVNFKDSMKGFITGFDGKILRTEDGGNTWQIIQLNEWKPVRAVAFLPDNEMVAVGGDAYGMGIYWRSTDGGLSWQRQDTTNYELRDVAFTDSKTGYACGYGTIIKTTDGGITWNFLDASDEFFSAIDFPSKDVGYAVGRTGTIVKTTDAGKSWKILRNGNIPIQTRYFFNDVKFVNENVGYVVGDKGVFWKTVDGGKNWKAIKKDTKVRYYGIYVWQEGKGVLVGEEGRIERFEEN